MTGLFKILLNNEQSSNSPSHLLVIITAIIHSIYLLSALQTVPHLAQPRELGTRFCVFHDSVSLRHPRHVAEVTELLGDEEAELKLALKPTLKSTF